METIDLKLDEQNELIFKVIVEGASNDGVARLVIESDDFALTFPGEVLDNNRVKIDIPKLSSLLESGQYKTNLEVIADGRFFKPLEFITKFKETVKISEAKIQKVNEVQQAPIDDDDDIKATATLISEKKKAKKTSELDLKELSKMLLGD